ncbi:unnamed protein product [Malus baccata var. baccata]|uniref:Uncharacterized protein n=1 Tax=Malus domestica TaxID=3750 RepID=A0A498KAE2_MALDO|nr:hypothetical protein DVH24_003976 [Malus domestica]
MVMIMLLQFCLIMELLCMFRKIPSFKDLTGIFSLEMMDGDNPASYLCSPEGLLQQVGLTHAAVLVTAGRAGSLGVLDLEV